MSSITNVIRIVCLIFSDFQNNNLGFCSVWLMRKTVPGSQVKIPFHKQSAPTGEAPPPTTKQPPPACLSVNGAVLCLNVASEATLTFQSEHVVRGKEARIKIFD